MTNNNEIIEKDFKKEGLTADEKFEILSTKRVNSKVIEYLTERLNNLYIEILTEKKASILELMKLEKLIGWCWETTESAIVFLNDEDYIERGNLYFDDITPAYYHSWICFRYDNKEYVLDPCLNILCKKEEYSKIFQPDVKGKVYAKKVKQELIKQLAKQKKNIKTMKEF